MQCLDLTLRLYDFDYNLQLEPTAVRDSLGRTVEARTTDDAGRVAEVTNIEGRVAGVEYGVLGLPLAITRFDGSRVTLGYDNGARLSALGLPGRTNTYAWLANGLLASASDSGTTVTNEWIAPGRLAAQETRAPGWTGRVAYDYDLAGAVTQIVAGAIGLTQTIGRDNGEREVSRDATCRGATLSATLDYASWNGLPQQMAVGPVEQHVGWDRLDRLTNLTWLAQDTVMREMAFSFDALGRITQRVDRAAGTVVLRGYAYDDLDRLIFETKSREPGIASFAVYSYDDAGRRSAKMSTGFDVEYANGTGDRLAGWVVTQTNMPGCMVAGTSSETIGADPRYGLREVNGGFQTVTPAVNGSNFNAQLAFDSFGAKTVVATVSDAAGNNGAATNSFVLAVYTAGDYLSDDAGCVTQIVYQGSEDRLERTLTWDAEYRLIAVSTNGVAAEGYGYDPFGRRIWTATAGVTNWHLYDGPHVLADLDPTGGVIRTYLYGPGIDELIAMTVYTGTVAETYYAIRDHQNTVWAWLDENGSVVESYDFDAWGRVLGVFDSNGTERANAETQIGNRYLWQGREYSWQTGLYFFRARWYDPITGRWLSNDPIGISGGLNQYVAFANNPLAFTDPLGLDIAVQIGFAYGITSPFGHVGSAVTGRGVYSFGTAEKAGTSFTDYLRDQALYRSSAVYVFKTTKVQDDAYLDAFEKVRSKTGIATKDNNCADAVGEGMKAAGLLKPQAMLGLFYSTPGMLYQYLELRRAEGKVSTALIIPKGATQGWDLVEISLVSFNPGSTK